MVVFVDVSIFILDLCVVRNVLCDSVSSVTFAPHMYVLFVKMFYPDCVLRGMSYGDVMWHCSADCSCCCCDYVCFVCVCLLCRVLAMCGFVLCVVLSLCCALCCCCVCLESVGLFDVIVVKQYLYLVCIMHRMVVCVCY